MVGTKQLFTSSLPLVTVLANTFTAGLGMKPMLNGSSCWTITGVECLRLSSAMTLNSYLDYWLRDVAAHEQRVSTFARYQALVNDYIKPYIGSKKLNRLAPSDIRKLMTTLEGAPGKAGGPLSGRTRQFIHAVLRSALQHAVREDLVGHNVAKLVSPPKAESREIIPLDRQQAREFLAIAQQHWLCALWLLLVMTGLRRGEALALAWSDVDLDSGLMRVRRTLQRINGEFLSVSQKADVRDASSLCRQCAPRPSSAIVTSPRLVPTSPNVRHSRISLQT
jgi:integrase